MNSASRFFFDTQPELLTKRLRLRAFRPEDADAMFVMDSDPEVHQFLGNQPVQSMERIHEIITFVQQQYAEFGIGRWVAADRETDRFLGWTGFKWIVEPINGRVHFLDIGYRFQRASWGQGLAFESAQACMEFAAQRAEMQGVPVSGFAAEDNRASRRILEKLGLQERETFEFMNMPVVAYDLPCNESEPIQQNAG